MGASTTTIVLMAAAACLLTGPLRSQQLKTADMMQCKRLKASESCASVNTVDLYFVVDRRWRSLAETNDQQLLLDVAAGVIGQLTARVPDAHVTVAVHRDKDSAVPTIGSETDVLNFESGPFRLNATLFDVNEAPGGDSRPGHHWDIERATKKLIDGGWLYGQPTDRPNVQNIVILFVQDGFISVDEKEWSKSVEALRQQKLIDRKSNTSMYYALITDSKEGPTSVDRLNSVVSPRIGGVVHRIGVDELRRTVEALTSCVCQLVEDCQFKAEEAGRCRWTGDSNRDACLRRATRTLRPARNLTGRVVPRTCPDEFVRCPDEAACRRDCEMKRAWAEWGACRCRDESAVQSRQRGLRANNFWTRSCPREESRPCQRSDCGGSDRASIREAPKLLAGGGGESAAKRIRSNARETYSAGLSAGVGGILLLVGVVAGLLLCCGAAKPKKTDGSEKATGEPPAAAPKADSMTGSPGDLQGTQKNEGGGGGKSMKKGAPPPKEKPAEDRYLLF